MLAGLATAREAFGDRRRPRRRPPPPRGSRGRARRPARSGPSTGRRGRSVPCRGARSRRPRRRAPRARRRPSPGASRGSRARSRSLELEVRRHLDVGHDHVRNVLGGGGEERRRVLGHPHHLDAVVRLEERAHALANEDVVLAEDDPDAHAARLSDVCTMRAWCAWSSRRITTSCEGTAALLQTSDEVELIGTASSFDELMTAVEELKPEAVLTDIRMPPSNTTEGIDARPGASGPTIPTSGSSSCRSSRRRPTRTSCSRTGRRARVPVEGARRQPRGARSRAERGRQGRVGPGSEGGRDLVSAKDRMAHSPLGQLTEREREVLENMAQGKNNASIAKSLFLTERAVEKHINSLFHKLGLGGDRRPPPREGGARLPARERPPS